MIIGTDANGREIVLPASGGGVLVAGPPGGGKSTLATALLEQIIAQDYQVCLLDPEGDYADFEPGVILGDGNATRRGSIYSNRRPITSW